MYDFPFALYKNKDLQLSMIRGLESVPQRRPPWTPPLDFPPFPEGKVERWCPHVPSAPADVPTSALRGQAGGADRARTGDPLVANQVLSQLSYSPEAADGGPKWIRTTDLTVISRALYQLSYRPVVPL